MSEERRKDYVDISWIKKGLFGAIITLLIHMSGGVWWAATVTAELKHIRKELDSFSVQLASATNDRYRGIDAVKDFKVVSERIERNEVRLIALEYELWRKKEAT